MSNLQKQIKFPNLNKFNLFKDIKPNTKIKEITPGKKQINIIVIILEKLKVFNLKNEQKIFSFLVADQTGSIICNFYDEVGCMISIGDIIYIQSAYASLFKNSLILYTPKFENGIIVKIDEFYMAFIENPNMSNLLWKKIDDNTFEIDKEVLGESIA